MEVKADAATMLSRAQQLAQTVLAQHAESNDQQRRFPTEAVAALRSSGLLGLTVPAELGGAGLGLRAMVDVIASLAERDASVAMIYVMHLCGTQCLVAAPSRAQFAQALRDISSGKHLTTLAFSEKGSRSHFWSPVSKAKKTSTGAEVTALKSWVTSAGQADSYVVSTQAPDSSGGLESNLYLLMANTPGVKVAGIWDGMGLRSNASAPMTLESVALPDSQRLTVDKGGLPAMLEVVLPYFSLGSAAMSLGLCRAAVAATKGHLQSARFEHLGTSLGAALPNLRMELGKMQIRSDALAALLTDAVGHLESSSPAASLRVLESKAYAGAAAIEVTSMAMHVCGGAAFSKHLGVERLFRDAHASAVMAPTGDVLHDLIGKALLGLPLL